MKMRLEAIKNKVSIYFIIVVGLVVLYILLAYAMDIIICPLRRFTGICCPICDSTHMVIYTLQGDFSAAIHANPLMFFLIPFTAIYWFFLRKHIKTRWPKKYIITALCILLLLNWLYILFFK